MRSIPWKLQQLQHRYSKYRPICITVPTGQPAWPTINRVPGSHDQRRHTKAHSSSWDVITSNVFHPHWVGEIPVTNHLHNIHCINKYVCIYIYIYVYALLEILVWDFFNFFEKRQSLLSQTKTKLWFRVVWVRRIRCNLKPFQNDHRIQGYEWILWKLDQTNTMNLCEKRPEYNSPDQPIQIPTSFKPWYFLFFFGEDLVVYWVGNHTWKFSVPTCSNHLSGKLNNNWLVATQIFVYFHPENWGNDPIWRSYVSNGPPRQE